MPCLLLIKFLIILSLFSFPLHTSSLLQSSGFIPKLTFLQSQWSNCSRAGIKDRSKLEFADRAHHQRKQEKRIFLSPHSTTISSLFELKRRGICFAIVIPSFWSSNTSIVVFRDQIAQACGTDSSAEQTLYLGNPKSLGTRLSKIPKLTFCDPRRWPRAKRKSVMH